jgi:amidohydrolase
MPRKDAMNDSSASPADPLIALRRRLHRQAERSGAESATAAILRTELETTAPDGLTTSLGGHGLAAEFQGAAPGPTVLLRADIDALPLPDTAALPHASLDPTTAHKCGHDGHMAMLVGVAHRLAARRPARGRMVLLFQPAEETGAGAAAVLADPAFAPLRPDRAVALHNLPGYALGTVIVRRGVFASASRGLTIALSGASSHAAEPHSGRSPVLAAAALAQALSALPQVATSLAEAAQVTVVGLDVGGPAFGTSPGQGRVMATVRTHDDEVMERLARRCEDLARGIATSHDLGCEIAWSEEFPAVVNDPAAVDRLENVAHALGLPVVEAPVPFAWSEDFGHLTGAFGGALVGLGAGEDQPPLHHPDYDFPDALIPHGVDLLERAGRDFLEDDR